MLNKGNIQGIIASLESDIAKMELESLRPYPEPVKKLIQQELGNLKDNCYRYKLQAKAWGLD